MSAMRILILGVLNDNKPRHGYEVRQILEAWGADKWANVGFGSIYFALKKCVDEGFLIVIEQENDLEKPDKVVYQITKSGNEIFLNLLRRQLVEIAPIIDPFQIGLTYMQYMQKDELIALLEHRVDSLSLFLKSVKRLVPITMRNLQLPRHIMANQQLVLDHYQAELNWITSTLEKIKHDELP